jgi:hypothetical protein
VGLGLGYLCDVDRQLGEAGAAGLQGRGGVDGLISIVFRTSVTDHGLHVIALSMVIVSVIGLLAVVADRTIMSRARVRRDDPPAGRPSASPGRRPGNDQGCHGREAPARCAMVNLSGKPAGPGGSRCPSAHTSGRPL